MRTTRVAGPGARSTPRQAERSANRPASARPSSRRGWRGARSARPPSTTGQAIEREPERAPLHAVQKVVAPALGEGSAAWWLIGGALALFLGGELLQLAIGHRLGTWHELWIVGAALTAGSVAMWAAVHTSGRARPAPGPEDWAGLALLSSPWCWIGIGCGLWAVGAVVRWSLPAASPHMLGPFAAATVRTGDAPLLLADPGFLGLVPLFLAGIALAFPTGMTTLPRARLVIDAVVLPTALGLLAYLVLGRTPGAPAYGDLHLLVSVAYPAAYTAVAFGALLGYRRLGGSGGHGVGAGGGFAAPDARALNPDCGYLVWAALLLVPGAALLAWSTLLPNGLARLASDACFVAGFLLVALEALETVIVAPAGGRADGGAGAAAGPRRRDLLRGPARVLPWWPNWNLPVAGTAAAAAVLVIATLELLLVRDVRPAIYLGSVGLLALVVSRQFIALVDNGRLIARLRVAGELEARLREVGLAVSRSLEQSEVLALVCQAGQRVFQADTVILWRADFRQHMLEIVAAVGDPARNFVGRRLDLDSEQALAARVYNSARTERLAYAHRAQRSDPYLTMVTRAQALLAVPLVFERRPLGVLVFGSENPEAFAPDDVIKAELLAAQAVGAMENARQYGELARRTDEAESLYQLSQATLHARTASDVACALLEVLRERLGFVHAAVYLAEGVARPLVPVAIAEDAGPIMPVESGRAANGRIPGLSTQLTDPILRQVAATGEPARLDGAARGDHRFVHDGMQVRLTVPLKLGDQVLGVVDLETSAPQAYTGTPGRTVFSLGHGAALTIDNLRLTEETREMETYRELDRLKSELLQTVSHELRTPLGAIKGFTTTLIEHDSHLSREEKHEFLEIIDQESDRLRGLIEDLLDMSKIEAGVLHLDRQAVSVAKLVGEAMKTVASHSPEHRFEASVPADLFADADPRRIRQVLHNLLENAVKYSPDGGMIHAAAIRTSGAKGPGTERSAAAGDYVVISVRDEGIGIARQDLGRVFDRFHRVDNEVGRRVGGSGLGLAICRGIVDAHGGRIWADSEPGRGSTFSFSLPAAAGDQQLLGGGLDA
jgi:signal transduction histidine kinase